MFVRHTVPLFTSLHPQRWNPDETRMYSCLLCWLSSRHRPLWIYIFEGNSHQLWSSFLLTLTTRDTHITYLSWHTLSGRPLWKTCHGDRDTVIWVLLRIRSTEGKGNRKIISGNTQDNRIIIITEMKKNNFSSESLVTKLNSFRSGNLKTAAFA
jgi:hypothetical protein